MSSPYNNVVKTIIDARQDYRITRGNSPTDVLMDAVTYRCLIDELIGPPSDSTTRPIGRLAGENKFMGMEITTCESCTQVLVFFGPENKYTKGVGFGA